MKVTPNITERREQIFAILLGYVRRGEIAPTDDSIGALIGGVDGRAVSKDVRGLRDEGRITTRSIFNTMTNTRSRIVRFVAEGIETADPKIKAASAGVPGVLSDDRLYGDLAGAVRTLRRAGHMVCKSETTGQGKGRYRIGDALVDAEEVRQRAAQIEQRQPAAMAAGVAA